jgi:putative endonuclease
MTKQYFVYIVANKLRTVLYTGVTNDLNERIDAHKAGAGSGFTTKYNVTRLVYFEAFTEVADAIQREKQLKRWRRAWKEALIGKTNPDWDELVP